MESTITTDLKTNIYTPLFELFNSKNIIETNSTIDINDILLHNNYSKLNKQIKKHRKKANKQSPINGMFYLLRKYISVLKLKNQIKNDLELIYFKDNIQIKYLEILRDISKKIRTMYLVDSSQVSYHNTSILLGNPELISIALFIMPFEEFINIYNKDLEFSSFKGSDRRSIFDMTYECLKNGLERSNSDYFTDYTFFTSSVTLDHITSILYNPIEMYCNSKEQDLSISKLKHMQDRITHKPKTVIYINPKHKQSEILKLFTILTEKYSYHYSLNQIAETFIQRLTGYKITVPKSYIFNNKNTFYEMYNHIDRRLVEDFFGILKYLSEKDIFTSEISGGQAFTILEELGYTTLKLTMIKSIFKSSSITKEAKIAINSEFIDLI